MAMQTLIAVGCRKDILVIGVFKVLSPLLNILPLSPIRKLF